MVEQTVYEQQWSTVMKKVQFVECVPVQKTRTINVTRCVPVQKQVAFEYTVMNQVQRTRAENYMECVPVVTPQQRTITEYTTRVESQPRQFVTCTPVCEYVTVTENCGGGGGCDSGCGGKHRGHKHGGGCGGYASDCGGCDSGCGAVTTRVVPVTRYVRNVETRNVNVNVCVPVQKQITVNVTTYQQVQRTRQVNYMECVPTKMQGQRTVTEYTTVTEPRQENYTEMTQKVTEKEVPTQVCTMVAKKIQVPVAPVTVGYGYGGGHCGTCGHSDCGGCDSGCGGKKHGGKKCGKGCK